VNIEDQVAALFAKANPVSSLDVLDPIEPTDVDSLRDRSERSREMTDVETPTDKAAAYRRWQVPALVAALGVIVAAAIIFSQIIGYSEPVQPTPTEAEAIVLAYIDALAANDVEAMHELVAPEAEDVAWDDQTLTQDWQRATGIVLTPQGCTERTSNGPEGALVDCTNTYDSSWHDALGLEPSTQATTYVVRDGKIRAGYGGANPEATEDDDDVARVWTGFASWVEVNHQDDVATMYHPEGGPNFTPESIALWEQYTDEFVAEHGG
jgi:hypothetical protein